MIIYYLLTLNIEIGRKILYAAVLAQLLMPVVSRAVENDICALNPLDGTSPRVEQVDRVDLYRAGFEVDIESLNSIDASDRIEFDENNIVGTLDPSKYNILILGTNYDDNALLEEDMADLITKANQVLADLDIFNIVYYKENIDIDLSRVDRLAINNDEERLKALSAELLQRGLPIDTITTMINTTEYLGVGSRYPIISSTQDRLFLFLHEVIGHSVGWLYDGYMRNNSIYELQWSTEFIVPEVNINHDVEEIAEDLGSPLASTDMVCTGRNVFTYYPSELDIMDRYIEESEILALESSVFNPLQVKYIIMRIEEKIDVRNEILSIKP